MSQYVRAIRYEGPATGGSSLPQRFMLEGVGSAAVKFPGNPQGPKILANELVGFQVARALGVDCPDFGVTRISEAVLGGPVMMVKDGITGNEYPFGPGLHFYSKWLENANTLDPNDLSGISLHNPQTLAAIPVMDLLLDNWDRSPWNPNVLVWRNGGRHQLMLIDFGLAFGSALWRAEDLERATFRPMDDPLYSAKLEPVFSKVRWQDIELHLRCLHSLDRTAFASMVAAVPEEWLPDRAEREAMVRFLEVRSRGISEYLEARWRKAVWWS